MKFNISEVNEFGVAFVKIHELPLPDKPVNVSVSKEYTEYNRPYGTVISTYKRRYVTVNGYIFQINIFENHCCVSSGVAFYAHCETFHKALQLGVKCVNAIQHGFVIRWVNVG